MSGEPMGSLRRPFGGFGISHNSERWFRMYGSELFVDLTKLSPSAGHLYFYFVLIAYQKRGRAKFSEAKAGYKSAFKWRNKDLEDLFHWELIEISDGIVLPKGYRAENQGVATVRPNIPTRVRSAVFHRDEFKCVYCGSHEDLSLDHIIPITQEGSDEEDNLVTACRSCNSSKSNKRLEDWQE